ncbi:MAG: hypothetical protein ACR2JG_04205 [Geodermatophilaceae bacterium]
MSIDMFTDPGTDPGTDPRSDPPPQADERSTIVAFLGWQRDTLELKCSGLDAAVLLQDRPGRGFHRGSARPGGCGAGVERLAGRGRVRRAVRGRRPI